MYGLTRNLAIASIFDAIVILRVLFLRQTREEINLRVKYIRVIEFPFFKIKPYLGLIALFTCSHVLPSDVSLFLIEQLRVTLVSGFTVL